MEKVKVLLDNKVGRVRLAARVPSITDYKVTTEFNILRTSVERPVKVR